MRAFQTTLLAAALCLLALAGCQRADTVHRTRGHVFGTAVEISIYGGAPERADSLSGAVLNEFDRLHHKYHAWQPSMLTSLNDAIARGEPFTADAEMVALLQSATVVAERSGNLFNPAIGRLIRLWGFQSSDIAPQAPPAQEIRRWLDARPRLADLRYQGNTISSTNKAVMIDLGGYAKGYALDRAAQILRQGGVKAALVNVGGNVLAIGQPGERPWRVGIQDPRAAGAVAQVNLRDNEAMGTSGDYQRYFLKDGKRHPHIIDPRSGYPIDLVASVTIVTSGGTDAGLRSDGNSKPLFITGPAGWEAMAARMGLAEVMLIDAQGTVHTTPAMRSRLAASREAKGGAHPALIAVRESK
ncbi:FAD:protein FMN transferase [Massilia antarctica]|uniref:FAD:protein FMN transferase n=1 Tax=Massilia antarctica TaxID=2765360 RepID=UPI0006BB8A63|nr:FAD:protein FMN transferase [Massilia sp. H27-R4]MCY0914246.1 FAD:protein FMN transferase [Massilia sp. H27-R4]CUI08655.1 Thiamin biosynthesis lipoprotein ApbE [Janthinobacterium sp. CG23_2]CUU32441.1 Thiamin biosynthesis lipoprotein ApbE [Janthinobacterium sp. CG23_2]